MNCPNCNKSIEEGLNVCSCCGKTINYCPICNQPLAENQRECPCCHYLLTEIQQIYRCKICGTICREEDHDICPTCRRMEEKRNKPPDTEEDDTETGAQSSEHTDDPSLQEDAPHVFPTSGEGGGTKLPTSLSKKSVLAILASLGVVVLLFMVTWRGHQNQEQPSDSNTMESTEKAVETVQEAQQDTSQQDIQTGEQSDDVGQIQDDMTTGSSYTQATYLDLNSTAEEMVPGKIIILSASTDADEQYESVAWDTSDSTGEIVQLTILDGNRARVECVGYGRCSVIVKLSESHLQDECIISAPEPELEVTGEFVFADSDRRYLTRGDLEPLTQVQCRIARNEIYARRGRLFRDEELQRYFNSCSWYRGEILPDDFQQQWLNEFEKANATLILNYEKEKGWV